MNKEAIIIAGANGTGKTTFARDFATRYPFKFINADEIAKSINPQNINQAKLEAGKLFFRYIRKAMEAGESVIIESTLSGKSMIGLIKELKSIGYFIRIVYIFLETPEVCIERIKERVLKGGHFVPDDDVVRRFHRSRTNFWNTYRELADKWFLVYNSEQKFTEFAFGSKNNFGCNDKKLFDIFIKGVEEK